MIFIGTPGRANHALGVLPRAASDTFLLQAVGVFLRCVVLQFGIHVAHALHAGLGEHGAGPFGHVSGHVVESVAVGTESAALRGYQAAVLGIVTAVGLEVGIETILVALHLAALPGEGTARFATGCILPLYLGRQAVALYLLGHAAQPLQEEVGAPGAEGICLFPGDPDHGIVVVGGIIEVELHVSLIVGIPEVVDPAGRVGEDVHDVGIQEVPGPTEGSGDGLTHNLAVVVDPCRILADHDLAVANLIVTGIGVQVAFLGIQAEAALCGCHVVVDFVAIVHLTGIQHLCSVDGMGDVDTLYGTLLVLVGLTPGDGLVPVQIRSDGISLLVLLYLIRFVATVGGVGQAFADDAVAHPVDKLTVLGIRDFRLVHPETVYRNITFRETGAPKGVILLYADTQGALPDRHHAKRHGLGETGALDTRHLAADGIGRRTGTHAGGQHHQK